MEQTELINNLQEEIRLLGIATSTLVTTLEEKQRNLEWFMKQTELLTKKLISKEDKFLHLQETGETKIIQFYNSQ